MTTATQHDPRRRATTDRSAGARHRPDAPRRRLGASRSRASSPWSCASPSTPGPGCGCWPASASPRSLTTGAIIAWAPREQFTYSQFMLAIGMPMTVILPIIAALSVTAEWSQRTGLATFTLVPHRGRVLLAKAVASVLVAVRGDRRHLRRRRGRQPRSRPAIAGIPPVWDQDRGRPRRLRAGASRCCCSSASPSAP